MHRPSARAARRRARRIAHAAALEPLASALHRGWDLADTVSILGHTRSGTTWVQELLGAGAGVCSVFEPMQGDPAVDRLSSGRQPSLGPDDRAPDLERFLRRVMRGVHVTPSSLRLASPRRLLTAEHLVVKHVQLNMAAGWLDRRFPDSPMVVVVRHPCAVVESMLRVSWADSSLDGVLGRVAPTESRQILELLDGTRSGVAAHAAAWAVETRALLEQTDPGRTELVSYEAAVDDPVGVLGGVLERLGLPRPADLVGRADRPSWMTSKRSSLRTGGDPVTAWVDELPAADRDEVLAVARRAGLEAFGPDPRPDPVALAEAHRRPAAV